MVQRNTSLRFTLFTRASLDLRRPLPSPIALPFLLATVTIYHENKKHQKNTSTPKSLCFLLFHTRVCESTDSCDTYNFHGLASRSRWLHPRLGTCLATDQPLWTDTACMAWMGFSFCSCIHTKLISYRHNCAWHTLPFVFFLQYPHE
ncbi:hypothetical protein BDU57DRAFT_315602 [Ampelomyces quisqualis]|uniref:Uncharacterized protein n=1 Tax=Ampelomyces quisqualis TaxID=50730 RepID=A0A6A5QDY6_AMPQU|nr:hypothetical protein BDU57DRAFT_315602 [Ampelomyces quisqualis]